MRKKTPKKPKTGEKPFSLELMVVLKQVGWSGSELSRRVGVSLSTAYKWLGGTSRTPRSVFAYLELILEVRRLIEALGAVDVRTRGKTGKK